MVLVFTVALFVSAGLLFMVQPMVAKGLLPLMGGSPSVWTTCMLFFQVLLLGGYLYAHVISTRLKLGVQIGLYCVLLVGALAAGLWALGYDYAPPEGGSPVVWLLMTLGLTVGPVFFTMSAAGPLLQRWFSASGHKRASDPYFLYAASNAGSLLGLLSYPFVIEPAMALGRQRGLWMNGFAVYLLLVVLCGAALLLVRKRLGLVGPGEQPGTAAVREPGRDDAAGEHRWLERGRWCVLAFIPSSLLLGVTMYLSTDVAAIPLLWVVPLAIYLVSFIIAFGTDSGRLVRVLRLPTALAIVLAVLLQIHDLAGFDGWVMVGHLIAFGMISTYCHGQLAHHRPKVARITEMYLVMAIGGALGGVFNAIIAPVVFPMTIEYPIALVLAGATLPWGRAFDSLEGLGSKGRVMALGRRYGLPIGLTVYMMVVLAVEQGRHELSQMALLGLIVLVPGAALMMSYRSGLVFGLSLIAVLGAATAVELVNPNVELRSRTFYGTHRVILGDQQLIMTDRDTKEESIYPIRLLYHGNTQHGSQVIHPYLMYIASTYYHERGPLGDVMHAMREREGSLRVGVVGLGTGTIAVYGREGDRYTYYEIDPEVVHIARDSGLFSYLTDTQADVDIVLGDGRLKLAEAPPGEFDLLIFDAFSSDAIPIHLLTVEAVEGYLRALKPDGVIALHVSNRRLQLIPIVGNLVARLGLKGGYWEDNFIEDQTKSARSAENLGRLASSWCVLSRTPEGILPIAERNRSWMALMPYPDKPTWTDEFSSMTDVIIWK